MPIRKPQQERARATLGLLLDATAALLDEGGLEQVTTNAVAARAGVNIATLYGYFPNKYALLGALAERLDEQRHEIIERALSQPARSADDIAKGLEAFIDFVISEPGVAPLMDALRTTPELSQVGADVHERITRMLVSHLVALRPDLGRARAQLMSRVVVEASSGIVGACRSSSPRRRRALLDEHAKMVAIYLNS